MTVTTIGYFEQFVRGVAQVAAGAPDTVDGAHAMFLLASGIWVCVAVGVVDGNVVVIDV